MNPSARIPGFRGECLWELDIAERQLTAIAAAIPAEKYDWRPHAKARSVSEVFVHIAAGNFMLLTAVGTSAPVDLYPEPAGTGEEYFWRLVRRNDDLEKTIRDKPAVAAMLIRSLEALRESLTACGDKDLDRELHFFGEMTTVRRVYLRLLAHAHEHMGQMIGYMRMIGMDPPWPDWRPDRRA